MMILRHNPKYEEIINFIRNYINYLTYSEIMELVKANFGYEFNCNETFIYHLRKNNIEKSQDTPRYRNKNIKGLRKEFEKELFKLEQLKKD